MFLRSQIRGQEHGINVCLGWKRRCALKKSCQFLSVALVSCWGMSLRPTVHGNTTVTMRLSEVSCFQECFSLQVWLQGRVRAGKRSQHLEELLPLWGKKPICQPFEDTFLDGDRKHFALSPQDRDEHFSVLKPLHHSLLWWQLPTFYHIWIWNPLSSSLVLPVTSIELYILAALQNTLSLLTIIYQW